MRTSSEASLESEIAAHAAHSPRARRLLVRDDDVDNTNLRQRAQFPGSPRDGHDTVTR